MVVRTEAPVDARIYQRVLVVACSILLLFAHHCGISGALDPGNCDQLATGTIQPSITARLNYCLIENREAGRDL